MEKRAGEVAAILASDCVLVPRHELLWLGNETDRFLGRLRREVSENKNVMLASLFCRWLSGSGVIALLERESRCKTLRRLVDDILYDCGELFRAGKSDPKYAASDIAEINRKLDMLLLVVPDSRSVVVDGQHCRLLTIKRLQDSTSCLLGV